MQIIEKLSGESKESCKKKKGSVKKEAYLKCSSRNYLSFKYYQFLSLNITVGGI